MKIKSFLIPLSLLIAVGITISVTYFFLPRPYQVHYHANMAVYIDGKQWDFSGNQYMEEVSRCNVQEGVLPADRIHLHENKGDLIHVHMAASTWGDLFSNLYWNFGTNYLVDDLGKLYLSGSGKSVYYILNGEVIFNPHNKPVESEDRLLIWYGTGSEAEILAKFYPNVNSDAAIYNTKEDPASCSANEKKGFIETITHIFE